MVRAFTIGLLCWGIAGCDGLEPSLPNSPIVEIPTGATLVIPGKGLSELSAWSEGALAERFPGELAFTLPSQSALTEQSVQWAGEWYTSLEGASVQLGFPLEDGSIPVQVELAYVRIPFTLSQTEDEEPCAGMVDYETPVLSFLLKGSPTRSGTTGFATLDSTLSLSQGAWTECTTGEAVDLAFVENSVVEQLPQTLAPQIRETLVEALALRVTGTTGAATKTPSNNVVRWVIGLQEEAETSELHSRGSWLHFDLNGVGASDPHPCSPPIEWPVPSEIAEPLTAAEMTTEALTESGSFSYGLVITRHLLEQWILHATEAGLFCTRSIPVAEEVSTALLQDLPGDLPIGQTAQLSLHMQPFTAPRVALDTTNDLFVLRLFFQHIRIDLNTKVDGMDIRLITVDGPVSIAIHPRIESGITMELQIVEVDALNLSERSMAIARSPFWESASLPSDLPRRLLQVAFENLAENSPPLLFPEPTPIPLLPLFPYRIGEDHAVFPFVFQVSESPSN